MQPGKTLTREACDLAFRDTRYRVAKFETAAAAAPRAGP